MSDYQHRKIAIAPILLFGLFVLIAVVLLLTSLTLWIGELTGSVIWGTLIVGGFFTLLALILYLSSVQESLRYVREQLAGITHAVQIIRNAYSWVSGKLSDVVCSLFSGLLRRL